MAASPSVENWKKGGNEMDMNQRCNMGVYCSPVRVFSYSYRSSIFLKKDPPPSVVRYHMIANLEKPVFAQNKSIEQVRVLTFM
jgi:hypothetical protein